MGADAKRETSGVELQVNQLEELRAGSGCTSRVSRVQGSLI